MAARIIRLRPKPQRLRAEQAQELRRLIVEYPGLPARARTEIMAAIDRRTASEAGWTFVMIGPEQKALVARWLRANSRYPTLALALWAELFTSLDRETGAIMLTRGELAERMGATSAEISLIMGELVRFGAIITRRERIEGVRGPGRVVYFMNPNVGTHLTGGARDKAQAEAPRLQLVE